jgi:DNA polymerase III sliding clamp (beta) subunit (PCNA family)
MLINRKNLQTVLSNMQVNSSNNSISALSHVYFKDNYIYQTNNEIVIQNQFFDEQLQENFSLPLSELLLLVSKLKDEFIQLEISDNIKLISKKSEIEFPKQEIKIEFNNKIKFDWKDLPDNFLYPINLDIYQIMKKVFPNVFSEGIEGVGLHPIRVNVA